MTEHSFSDYIIIIIIIVVADTTWTYCTYTAKLTTPGADAQNAKRAVTKSDGLRASAFKLPAGSKIRDDASGAR